MTPSLIASGLETRHGDRAFHYDLALDGAGLVAVTGPSGSGKSTFFHMLAGFETPLSGDLMIDGKKMSGSPPGKRPLTYIFQDQNLFSHLDVFTNVALGISPSLKLATADREAVERALAAVGLQGFSGRSPEALSGGERQRVAFARALVRKRPLLLLDEPFASLDPSLRREMGALLARLIAETSMLVLMITHDPLEVEALAGRVVEIADGRIIFAGTVNDRSMRQKNSGNASENLKNG